MAEWTNHGRARALSGAFGGPLAFGLGSGGRELTDSGYARISGEMAEPQGGTIANGEQLKFPPLAADAQHQIDEVLIFDAAGNLIIRNAIEEVPVIPRLQIVLEPGDVSAELVER